MKTLFRNVLLFVALAVMSIASQAQTITAERAYEIANAFFAQGSTITRSIAPQLEKVWDSSVLGNTVQTRNTVSDTPTFHVFSNVNGQGFIIVAGEESDCNIIGYSFDGELPDANNIPEAMSDYLTDIDNQIRVLRASGSKSIATRAAVTDATTLGTPVVELNTAAWGQRAPYNNLCFTTSGASAVTGCVPTAYAILMHYYKWPVSANEKKVYHSGTGESMTLGHEYDWDNMLSDYSNGYNDTQAAAVATLMRDLGWAYQVDYGTSGTQSGAGGEHADKLMTVFKYKSESPNVMGVGGVTVRDVLGNDATWLTYIKQSLNAGCPIPYSSTTTGGGRHIFILDGYTENDYFHFNWGWSGQGNGYFTLSDMTPDSNSDYSNSHRAYFMLKPDAATVVITVAVNNSEAGVATVNGESAVTVAEGSTVTLKAESEDGYRFVNWTLNGEEVSTLATYATKASSDAEYIANFEEVVVTENVEVSVVATEGGSATVNGATSVSVEPGTEVELVATPSEGYRFVNWTVGTEVVSTSATFTTTIQANKTYTANFAVITTEKVTIRVSGSGGYRYIGYNGTETSTSCSVVKGSTVYVRTEPGSAERKFAFWTVGKTYASGGTIVSNKNPYEFIAESSVTLYINYVDAAEDLNVNVSVESADGGSASVNGSYSSLSVPLGEEIVLVATPNAGYNFAGWILDNATDYISTEANFTTVVTGEATYTAKFENTTGIDDVTVVDGNNEIYDMCGRKIKEITVAGIYIINGKKVLVK